MKLCLSMAAKDQLQSLMLPILSLCCLISEVRAFMISEAYGIYPLGTDQWHICQKKWRKVCYMRKTQSTIATQTKWNNCGTTASFTWRPPNFVLIIGILTESYLWKAVHEHEAKQCFSELWSFYKVFEACTDDLLIPVFSKASVSPSSDLFHFPQT